jgi:hypothetical protein
MINPIKYTTGSESLALKKGNFYIGTGDVGKGPSDVTGYYQGVSPSGGGYVIYMNKPGAPGDLSYHNATNDSELISFTNNLAGTSYTTVQECLVYFAGQTDKVVFNRDYEPIVTDGLVLNLDAGFTPSYPRSGTTWYDVSTNTNNGTLTNGPTFNSGDGGSIVLDGVDDKIDFVSSSNYAFGTEDFTVDGWVWRNGTQSNNAGIAIVWTGVDGAAPLTSWQFGVGSSALGNINKLVFYIGSETDFRVVDPNEIPNQTWTYIAVTRSGSTVDLYKNDILVATNSSSQNLSDTSLAIARNRGALNRFNGRISNIRFYKGKGFTATEILQNYNAQKARFGL